MMFPELRADRRYACEVRALGASTVAFAGTVRDLSVSGVCLTGSTPLEAGGQLHLEFELPTGRVEALGEIRRVGTTDEGLLEFGIRFVRISAEAQGIIRSALEKHRW